MPAEPPYTSPNFPDPPRLPLTCSCSICHRRFHNTEVVRITSLWTRETGWLEDDSIICLVCDNRRRR